MFWALQMLYKKLTTSLSNSKQYPLYYHFLQLSIKGSPLLWCLLLVLTYHLQLLSSKYQACTGKLKLQVKTSRLPFVLSFSRLPRGNHIPIPSAISPFHLDTYYRQDIITLYVALSEVYVNFWENFLMNISVSVGINYFSYYSCIN